MSDPLATPSSITPAIDRLFRSYYSFATAPTDDSLFLLLTALHSLDDKLNKEAGRVLFGIPEYIFLKALRNHFHHAGEVKNVCRVKLVQDLPMTTDLMAVCLVSQADCLAAIAAVPSDRRQAAQDAFETTVKHYGAIVDINPCIFNGVVKVYEKLTELGLRGESAEFSSLEDSYELETDRGFSHYIDGAIRMHPGHAGTARDVLAVMYAN